MIGRYTYLHARPFLSLSCVVGSILLSGTLMAEEGGLHNKRLFFSHSQRAATEAMQLQPSLENQQTVSMHSAVSDVDSAPEVANFSTLNADSAELRFTAVVSGTSAVILLINGSPCRSLSHRVTDEQNTSLLLDCPQLATATFSLRWLPEQQKIMVLSSGGKTTVLSVGEGI